MFRLVLGSKAVQTVSIIQPLVYRLSLKFDLESRISSFGYGMFNLELPNSSAENRERSSRLMGLWWYSKEILEKMNV